MTNRPKLPDLPLMCDGPFRHYPENSRWIVGVDQFGGDCHVAEVRGWGYLTGGAQALALSDEEAFAAQRKTAHFIVQAMNEKLERHKGMASDPRDEAITRLVEALSFYGDLANYEGAMLTDPCGCCSSWQEPAIHETTDNGKTARAALAFAKEQLK